MDEPDYRDDYQDIGEGPGHITPAEEFAAGLRILEQTVDGASVGGWRTVPVFEVVAALRCFRAARDAVR
jgi:hypothetical protein